jgi:uncharacterized membrane protein
MPLFDRHHDDDAPLTLVGIQFADAFRAQEFLTAATGLASKGSLTLKDAVFVAADAEGKTVVRETVDPSPGRSALGGAMWTGLLGLILGGPIGWIGGLAVGAGTGAVTAKIVDLGIPDEWVDWFRKAVHPGSVILALLVTNLDETALVDEAARFSGAHLVYTNLDSVGMRRLEEALGEEVVEADAPADIPELPHP